ncbi:MAG: EAL domain-containing protein [Rhodospirillales bacterium]|nr:EAL domain-containing protein [Rhodospirillales bacterium]
MLHARMPVILGANLVNGTLLAWFFAHDINTWLLWSWFSALLLSVAGRAAAWYRYRNLPAGDWRGWEFAAVTGSTASGLLWGIAGAVFFLPQSVILATLTAFVLGGMAAGALALLTAHLPAFRLYVVLSLLPFCLRLVWEGGNENLVMAAMFLTYMIAVLVVGPQMHKAIIESLDLRFENRKLLRNLEDRVSARTVLQAAVVDFSQRALSGLALDVVLAEAAAIVRDGLSATGTLILQRHPDNVLIVRAHAGPPGEDCPETRFMADPDFVASRALMCGEPLLVNDVARDPAWKVCPPLAGRGVRSILCVPIWIDGRAQAVLQAWSTGPQSLATDDINFVRSVATTVAAAVQRRRAEDQAQRLARHDPLTTLPNRTLFREDLARSLSRSTRSERCAAVLLIDLDHFKDVNDSLGHPTGDLLLVKAAERLRQTVRREDPPARLGGDEFAIVLSDLERAESAAMVADHIVRAFSEPFDLDGHIVQVSASVGITIFPDDGQDPDRLLRNADLALYRAKENGRAGYEFYSKDMTAIIETRMTVLRNLRGAIERGEFTLVYQPQISLGDGRIAGAEALLRWHNGTQGIVMPREFIPIAEANGLVSSIDNWAIRRACAQSRQWSGSGAGRVVTAVNVSLVHWRRRDAFPDLERTLTMCDCDLSSIELEISERAFPLTGEGELADCIRRIRALGVSISIDDFGTGYLNLVRLRQLPVDRIKIDRSLIAGVGSDLNADAIVRAIIVLGHNLGLQVVAEGVETEAQLDLLRAEGCDFAQGFHLARPLSAEALWERISDEATNGWVRTAS